MIQSSRETLEKLIAEIAEKEEEFNKSLSENGFENKEAYESAKCERKKINEYADISKKYHDELNSAKTTLNKLIKDTKNISYIDIEVLNTELNELKSEIDKKGIAKEDISIRAANNKKILEGIEKIKGGMSEVFEYYKNCRLISDAAKGSINGKDKLPFELYIQSVYFDDILNHANTRLKIMSGGRYELVRAESADSRQRKTGLDIEVIDNYTALSRGVNSLSGGESFMAALSLALGLSDVIQYESGGIHIDTMFVDEGFGSLDAESLNSALKVLQNLTEGDRMVGIISHIEELKERIDRKIIVTKLSGGRSTLKLVR
ncbi:MAG TPA: SbcC/MukB-like Walker B domain-containing protein [Methanocorpusculum sp.]|nr:SbcC/MukB-like Walker B domain-containing protein [Methanocorpusculum sp.]